MIGKRTQSRVPVGPNNRQKTKKMKKLARLACIASMALSALAAQAETYAVMIGICDYPDVADKAGNPIRDDKGQVINNDLSGCVNDIKSYEKILLSKYGVKKENVKVLIDKEANEANFVSNMKWILGTAKPGDQVMFFYSGHGTQYDKAGEEDGKEEAIVLADMTLVDGDLFRDISQALSKAGMNATFVFDSCFSGGMSRPGAMYEGQPLKSAKTRLLPQARLGAKAIEFSVAKEVDLKAIPKKKGAAQGGSYAFIMAGKEDQPTIDLDFKDEAKEDHGLFTLLFSAMIQDLPDASVEEIVKAIEKFLSEKEFKQNPTFEFSSSDRGQKPFFLKA